LHDPIASTVFEITPPFYGNRSEFLDKTCSRKTIVMGLPYGENFNFHNPNFNRFCCMIHQCDRQTDTL